MAKSDAMKRCQGYIAKVSKSKKRSTKKKTSKPAKKK